MLPLLLVTAVTAASPDWWSGVEWGSKLVEEQAITSPRPGAQGQARRTVEKWRGQKGGISIVEEERGRGGEEGWQGGPEERSLGTNKVRTPQWLLISNSQGLSGIIVLPYSDNRNSTSNQVAGS